jgi:hypothetical protein
MNNAVPILTIALMSSLATAGQWQPQPGPLVTRWAKQVSPDKVHPEYPRPQMVRDEWQNLNGLWEYAIRPKTEGRPAQFDGQILVPFPVESALSGVMRPVDENQRLWYRRAFELPADWSGKRVLLHFGAADWEATVWVNGKELGTHRGGYDPFTFDITDALAAAAAGAKHELLLAVWDPTDAGTQPRGKQVRKPEGIWYTATTGIWQTVWLEPVPDAHIDQLKITPDVDRSLVRLTVAGPQKRSVKATVLEADREISSASGPTGTALELPVENAKLWSPDDPFLYNLKVELLADGQTVDQVASYFGMRKIALGKDEGGVMRLMLNNKRLFMFGPLDQGFWPDGLYTAPTDDALRYDIEMIRGLGFNLARKHVKVEPDRWYYWADTLGLLVWQDMPSGDAFPGDGQQEIKRSKESAEQFELELRRLTDARGNHPSLVMWVPFNEGWGQYDTRRIAAWVKEYDPSRLVDQASGWSDMGTGDVHDIHDYPGPASPDPEPQRAAVLGEFGGLGLPVAGHMWLPDKGWGYRSFKSPDELTEAYLNLAELLRPLVGQPGLSAAVYTQTTDVEIEINGLMTYDRAQVKPDAGRLAAANRRLYLPPPTVKTVVPTSQEQGIAWRYTTDAPPAEWSQPDFDDARWAQGPAGFGRDGTPGIVVRTAWHAPDIWIRRSFELASLPARPQLKLYHDEDCDVYINGKPVAAVKGYTTSYVLVPMIDKSALSAGRNVLAIHCHQTAGGQGIDAGLVDVVEAQSRKPVPD